MVLIRAQVSILLWPDSGLQGDCIFPEEINTCNMLEIDKWIMETVTGDEFFKLTAKKLRVVFRSAHFDEEKGKWLSYSGDEIRTFCKITTIETELRFSRLSWLQEVGRDPAECSKKWCVLTGHSACSTPQSAQGFAHNHTNPCLQQCMTWTSWRS